MNQHTETILEINQIKEQLMEFAYTENAKEQIRNLKPYLSEGDLKRALMDTTEAKEILEKIGTPPMTSFDHVEEYLEIAEKGGCLTEEQLEEMAMVLSSVKRLKEYLNRAKELPLNLPYYEEQLVYLSTQNQVNCSLNSRSLKTILCTHAPAWVHSLNSMFYCYSAASSLT